MARARTAKHPAPAEVEPEEISQEVPEDEPEAEEEDEPEAAEKGLNKSQAARAAIDAGYEKPGEAVSYIKSEFGIDMNPQHFSAIKSNYRKKQEGEKPKAKPGRKPKSAAPSQAVEGYLAPPPKQAPVGGETDLLAAMEAMKPLVASMGAEKVKRLVDLLG